MKFVNNLENVFGKYEKYLGEIFSKDLSKGVKLKKIASNLKSKTVLSQQKLEDTADWENKNNITRVFEKFDLKSKICSKPEALKAAITVVSGLDEGCRTKVNESRVNIGRRPSNEMVLNDKNASRLHSYIVPQEGSHIIYDAQSLNGTYVNGKHIITQKLVNGDEIKIGNTVILYTID